MLRHSLPSKCEALVDGLSNRCCPAEDSVLDGFTGDAEMRSGSARRVHGTTAWRCSVRAQINCPEARVVSSCVAGARALPVTEVLRTTFARGELFRP